MGEQLELGAAVDLEGREVARVDADHRRVDPDCARQLVRVMRFDERVEPECARDPLQRARRLVLEVAQQEEHCVRAGLARGLQLGR